MSIPPSDTHPIYEEVTIEQIAELFQKMRNDPKFIPISMLYLYFVYFNFMQYTVSLQKAFGSKGKQPSKHKASETQSHDQR